MNRQDADDGMDELRSLLVRYADAALAPDPASMERIRRTIRAEAQGASVRRRAEAVAIAVVPPAPLAAPRPMSGGRSVRRLSLALAASLALGLALGTTAFAASQAGGPLYETRVWLEELTLPSDPVARLPAEVARAETRLAEAAEAASRADAEAVMAALAAYGRIVDETIGAASDAIGRERAALAFQHHLDVLRELQDRVPNAAKDAIRKAADKSDKAKDRLETPAPGKPTDPGNKPAETPPPGKTPPPRTTPNPPGQGGQGPPADPGGQGGVGGQQSSTSEPDSMPGDAKGSNRP